MDRISEVPLLDGWVPIRFYWRDEHPMVDWCYFGDKSFTEPFFAETVTDCLRLPFNLVFRHQTSIDTLRLRHETKPGLQPTGFIFHMSRCGSTLLSQLLAQLPSTIVISEAGPIDSILRSHLPENGTANDRRVGWLRWLISALGQQRLANERYFFIKFDSWNILYFSLIRQAFPNVPWIFLYRDPVEVLVSQLAHRGAHMIPHVIKPELFGMGIQTATSLLPDDYCAKVLATICQSALKHNQDGGRLINYTQLPDIVWTSILDFFGASVSESELQSMQAAAQFDAKNPKWVFSDDRTRKKEQATESVMAAAERWLYPVYEELEATRLATTSS
jgi:gluconate kinase